jgi:signal transduction histidine kinase
MVDHILRGVRQLSLDLRPSLLDDLGLAAALRWYVGAQAGGGYSGDVVTEDVPADLPAATATTCYRIAQEAVTNAIRHAATRITVTSAHGESAGDQRERQRYGFDVATARRRVSGRQRGTPGPRGARGAGGRPFEHRVDARKGTVLRAWLPL